MIVKVSGRSSGKEQDIMGIYVNPGNAAFEMARFSDIYVDKSMLINKINHVYRTEQRFVCVSRPRRFGKSMAANMLSAYYSRGCDSAAQTRRNRTALQDNTHPVSEYLR